jgi:uncharacterized protein (DUF2141 family)
LRRSLLILFLAVFFQRCAQVGTLSGGKKDTTPPVLKEAIPAPGTTNFKSDEIILKFDEFIQLKELNNQLIISPRLKTAPEIVAEGRNIKISLKKEDLAPSTTYRLYFGKAIADLNESNSIDGFEYYFSTGENIDSLKLGGKVSDALTNRDAHNILIGLYRYNKSDSIVMKEQPDYSTRTSVNGEYRFTRLPPASFKVYAIDDKNKNGIYDGEGEKIGFLEDDFTLSRDSSANLRIFQEEPSKTFIRRTLNPYYGFTQIILNKRSPVTIIPLNAANTSNVYETLKGSLRDTVTVYYRKIEDTLKLVMTNHETSKKDTLSIGIPKNSLAKRKMRSYRVNAKESKLQATDRIRITFNTWMDTSKFNPSRIRLSCKEDSIVAKTAVTGRWKDITNFEITNKLMENSNYSLRLDTGAFYDHDRIPNDSSLTIFKTGSRLDFGKVTLKVVLNKKQAYLIQLINELQAVVKETFISFSLSSANSVTVDFTDVPPGNYQVRIIYDDNGNQKWDAGNMIKKLQPEKVLINTKQLKVLSDWEIVEEISFKE